MKVKAKINIAIVLLITFFKTAIGSFIGLLILCLIFQDKIERFGIADEYSVIILFGGIVGLILSLIYCLVVLLPTYFIDKKFIETHETIESFKRLIPFPALIAFIISLFFISTLIEFKDEFSVIAIMFLSNLYIMVFMSLYFFLSTFKNHQNKNQIQITNSEIEK
ncbi:MAG: hypothetical protein K9J13_06325 [Saprospiraceae bacterium]|nr:hypothetical protein [Saprospiraceae bacterium]